MQVRWRWIGVALGAVSMLTGCVTPGPLERADLRSTSQASAAGPVSALKVNSFNVKWAENPDFKIRLERTIPAVASALVLGVYEMNLLAYHPGEHDPNLGNPNIPDASKRMADAYIGEILRLHKENAPAYLATALKSGGAREGNALDITVTPLVGFQSIDGWGTHVVFRTDFIEKASERKWSVDVAVKSGIHWVGVANASKPTVAFVEQYVDNLLTVLRHANAL